MEWDVEILPTASNVNTICILFLSFDICEFQSNLHLANLIGDNFTIRLTLELVLFQFFIYM